MKYRKNYILILLFSIFILGMEVVHADSYADVIIQVADAYYRKGTKIQYDDYRKGISHPEDATADSVKYMVCSYFPMNVYKEAFDLDLPSGTGGLTSLGNIHYKEGKKYSDVILGYSAKSSDDGLNNVIKSKFSSNSVSNYKTFIDTYTGGKDLAVGDVISFTWTITKKDSSGNVYYDHYGQGHTIMIYDVIKENGKVVDAIVMEVAGTNISSDSEKTESLKQVNDLTAYGIPTLTQGAIRASKFSYYLKYNFYDNLVVKGGKKITSLTVIRPLGFDPSTKTIGKTVEYKYTLESTSTYQKIDDKNTLRIYTGNIKVANNKKSTPKSSLFRIEKKGLDVEKTSDKHFAYVYKGQIITYTIKLKNYSKETLTGLNVYENIGSNVGYKESNANGKLNDGKVMWSNLTIKSGQSLTLQYKVAVRGTGTVKATGRVYSGSNSVTTTTIENEIANDSLGTNMKSIISNVNSTSNRNKYGLDYINAIYSNVVGTDKLISSRSLSTYFDYSKLNFKENTSLYPYVTKYRTSWALNLYPANGKHNLIAPALNNLFTGDVIWAVNQEVASCVAKSTCKEKKGSEFQYLYVMVKIGNANTNVLIRNDASGLTLITKNGKYQCTTSKNDCDINKINLNASVNNVSNGWKKVDNSTTFKVLENLPCKYAYAIFSLEKYVGKTTTEPDPPSGGGSDQGGGSQQGVGSTEQGGGSGDSVSSTKPEKEKPTKPTDDKRTSTDQERKKEKMSFVCSESSSNKLVCKVVLDEDSYFVQLDMSITNLDKYKISSVSSSDDWKVEINGKKMSIVKVNPEKNGVKGSTIVTFEINDTTKVDLKIDNVIAYDNDGNEYSDIFIDFKYGDDINIDDSDKESSNLIYYVVVVVVLLLLGIIYYVIKNKKSTRNNNNNSNGEFFSGPMN